MSSIITRMIFSVALGIVGAVACYVFKASYNTGRNAAAHAYGGRGGRSRRRSSTPPDSPVMGRSTWEVYESEEEPFEEITDEDFKTPDGPSSPALSATESTKSNKTKKESPATTLLSSCQICLEKFTDIKRRGGELYSTPCGHIFCKCLLLCLEQKPNCPSCRADCEPHETHKIYL